LLLRVIPQLHFVYDESIERASNMTNLIEKTVADDMAKAMPDTESETESDQPQD
jgi:ribosome-binding factor A